MEIFFAFLAGVFLAGGLKFAGVNENACAFLGLSLYTAIIAGGYISWKVKNK